MFVFSKFEFINRDRYIRIININNNQNFLYIFFIFNKFTFYIDKYKIIKLFIINSRFCKFNFKYRFKRSLLIFYFQKTDYRFSNNY